MLCDRSRYHTTKIESYGFRRDGIFRQLVLQPGITYEIGAGGEKMDQYTFELHWTLNGDPRHKVEQGFQSAEQRVQNPRWARTEDDNVTELPSWYNTRLHTPKVGGVQRVITGGPLGRGAFGEVKKALDLDSGCYLAVKIISPGRSGLDGIRREVKTLQTIKYPNIVEYLGSSGWDTDTVHIYTSLKAGNINDLFQNEPQLRKKGIVLRDLWRQMLEGLDYLAFHNLIHRDVKPDNILFTPLTDCTYVFQLADFGLANQLRLAHTFCGTRKYMAPEIFEGKPPQTTKADVWSLATTLLDIVVEFPTDPSYQEVRCLLREALESHKELQPMMKEDPTQRASAAQMLVLRFGGKGLTTPRNRIQVWEEHQHVAGMPAPQLAKLLQAAGVVLKETALDKRPAGIRKARVLQNHGLPLRKMAKTHKEQPTA